MKRTMKVLAVLGGFAGATEGCGGAAGQISQPLAPVSGTILLNGSPLAGAGVTFHPLAEGKNLPTSAGRTDAEGRYTLEVVTNGRKGAVVGEHIVRITHPDDEGLAKAGGKDIEDAGLSAFKGVRRVPERYATDSPFRQEVPPGGTAEVDFELKSR